MKYIAEVTKVLHPRIHKIGTIENGQVKPTITRLPLPDRVEIELEGTSDEPCMMYRYTNSGEFCGDTWHENLQNAFLQAAYEYGLSESDFKLVLKETT